MNAPNPGNRSKSRAPSPVLAFFKGLLSGLILGVTICAGVALYVSRMPLPFVTHLDTPTSTASPERASAEIHDNTTHGILAPQPPVSANSPPAAATAAESVPAPTAPAVSSPPANPTAPTSERSVLTPAHVSSDNNPAPLSPALRTQDAILPTNLAPVVHGALDSRSSAAVPRSSPWFVQTGAFAKAGEAENQRAQLALLGLNATVIEPEATAKPLYRVRLGPIPTQEELHRLLVTLKSNGIPSNVTHASTKSEP